jgi:hypothetical protein
MSTPNFHQQQSAQRMHQQAAQSAQRMHQQAAQSAQQASRMAADAAARNNAMARAGHAGMRWSPGGSGTRGPFSLIGFVFKLVLLAVIVAVAINLVGGTFDLDLPSDPGRPRAVTEATAPEGP